MAARSKPARVCGQSEVGAGVASGWFKCGLLQKLDYRLFFIDGDLFRRKYYTRAKKLSSSAIFSA